MSTSLGFSSSIQPARSTYAGLFLTTLSLLQLQFFLTRIYSVTMYYHFAFMAISLAMFGIAAGAVWIQLTGKGNPHELLSKMTLLFAISTAVCFAVQLQIPINPREGSPQHGHGLSAHFCPIRLRRHGLFVSD